MIEAIWVFLCIALALPVAFYLNAHAWKPWMILKAIWILARRPVVIWLLFQDWRERRKVRGGGADG